MKTKLIILSILFYVTASGAVVYAGGGASVQSGTYVSGGSITGSAGQTCTLSSFNNSSTATATAALTGTNTIAGGTALTITYNGGGATSAPTSATLGNGTATCSGTATITTSLGYVDWTFTGDTKANIITNVTAQLQNAGWTTPTGGILFGTYTSGATVTGSTGQTCNVGSFNNGLTGASVTLALTGTSTVASGTRLVINSYGSGASSAPTSAVLTSGTATCSGTVTLATKISNDSSFAFLTSAQAQSAYQIGIWLIDNGGNCVQAYLGSSDMAYKPTSFATTNGASLLPGVAKTYRILASRYQFVAYTANTSSSREFVWAGMVYVPSFLTASVTRNGFLFSEAINDTDTTVRMSLRTAPEPCGTSSNSGNYQILLNGAYWEWSNNANGGPGNGGNFGAPRFIFPWMSNAGSLITSPTSYRWKNNAILTGDVLFSTGPAAIGDEAMAIGQIYDAVFITDSVAIDTTASFDSPAHTYRNLTNTNAGSWQSYSRGGIWFSTN